jgi:hypothetical protein
MELTRDLFGYAAAAAVLVTFLVKSMGPLRTIAVLSNVLFIAYGWSKHIYPVLLLHIALLPINLLRLHQHRAMSRANTHPVHLPLPVMQAARNFSATWFVAAITLSLLGSYAISHTMIHRDPCDLPLMNVRVDRQPFGFTRWRSLVGALSFFDESCAKPPHSFHRDTLDL